MLQTSETIWILFFFPFLDGYSSLQNLRAIIIFTTYGHQAASKLRGRRGLSLKTWKRACRSPASALHCATWCLACLISLVQANPTVTNCALLFTLITPSEEVGLCWARPRSTSGSQRSQSSRVATFWCKYQPLVPPSNAPTMLRPLTFYLLSICAQTSRTFYREINAQ